jgi:hypothetical protein
MQVYRIFTGILIFLVTAGAFFYMGVASYLYRTKAFETEESAKKEEMPSMDTISIAQKIEKSPETPPPPQKKSENPTPPFPEESSHIAPSTETDEDFTQNEEPEKSISAIPITETSSTVEAEPLKEKKLSEPKTVYMQSCKNSLDVLDDKFLSGKVCKKIELEILFNEIKSLCKQDVPESLIDYIKDLYKRKTIEFTDRPEETEKLKSTSESLANLYKEFQIENQNDSMVQEVCTHLKNELEGYLEHPEVEDQQKAKENLKRKTDAFSTNCLQSPSLI